MTTPDHIWISPTSVDGAWVRIDRAEPQRQGYTRDDLTLTPEELATVKAALDRLIKYVERGMDRPSPAKREAMSALSILASKGPKP